MLLKTRLDAATALLVTHDKVTDVAALCGYTDHSAFTRQFTTVGVTPTEYRLMLQERVTRHADRAGESLGIGVMRENGKGMKTAVQR